MQFNDTANLTGMIQHCEMLTGLGYAQISGDTSRLKEFTRLINTAYHKVINKIIASTDEWDFDDPNHADSGYIKSINTVSGTRSYELALADKILTVKRVEITYDGTNWYKAEPLDQGEFSGSLNDATVDKYFTKTAPYYDVIGKDLYMYPEPDANQTAGLKVWTVREVDEFTTADTIQEPGIAEPFHEMLPMMACEAWGMAHKPDLMNVIIPIRKELEFEMLNFYGRRNEDRHGKLKPAYVDYE